MKRSTLIIPCSVLVAVTFGWNLLSNNEVTLDSSDDLSDTEPSVPLVSDTTVEVENQSLPVMHSINEAYARNEINIEDSAYSDDPIEGLSGLLHDIDLSLETSEEWSKLADYQDLLASQIDQGLLSQDEALRLLETVSVQFSAPTAEVLMAFFEPSHLAEQLVDLIPTSTGDAKQNYLTALSMTGTQNKTQRQMMISQLSGISDPSMYATALSTITPIGVEPGERQDVRVVFDNSMNSNNPEAISATFSASSSWNFDIKQSDLEYGLSHPSENVRITALTYVNNRISNGTDVKSHLFSIINNDTLSERERFAAHDALGNFDLTSTEDDNYQSFWNVVKESQQAE